MFDLAKDTLCHKAELSHTSVQQCPASLCRISGMCHIEYPVCQVGRLDLILLLVKESIQPVIVLSVCVQMATLATREVEYYYDSCKNNCFCLLILSSNAVICLGLLFADGFHLRWSLAPVVQFHLRWSLAQWCSSTSGGLWPSGAVPPQVVSGPSGAVPPQVVSGPVVQFNLRWSLAQWCSSPALYGLLVRACIVL